MVEGVDGTCPLTETYMPSHTVLNEMLYTSFQDFIQDDNALNNIANFDWTIMNMNIEEYGYPFIVCVDGGRQGTMSLMNTWDVFENEPLWTRNGITCYTVYSHTSKMMSLMTSSNVPLKYVLPFSGIYQVESTLLEHISSGTFLENEEECVTGLSIILPKHQFIDQPERLEEFRLRILNNIKTGIYLNEVLQKFYWISLKEGQGGLYTTSLPDIVKSWVERIWRILEKNSLCDYSEMTIECDETRCVIENLCNIGVDENTGIDCLLGLIAYLTTVTSIVHIENVGVIEPMNIDAARISQTQNSFSIGYKYWDAGLNGTGQIAMVWDGGFSLNNCYLKNDNGVIPPLSTTSNCTLPGAVDMSLRKSIGYVLGSNARPVDNTYHGTHCAGSVAGYSAGTTPGKNTWAGMAPGAKLVYTGYAYGSQPSVTACMLCASRMGAYVFSWSFGVTRPIPYDGQANSYDTYCYNNDNFTFFQSAGNKGNSGKNTRSVWSMAQAKNTVLVGASQNRLNTGFPANISRVAYFSSIGPTSNGRIKPDIVSPGMSVNSAKANTTCDIRNMQGTSMACPVAAGTALVIRQYYMEGYYPTGVKTPENAIPNPSSALIKATMITSTIPMESYQTSYSSGTGFPLPPSPTIWSGFGRLTLNRVLRLNNENYPILYVKDRQAISEGQVQTYKFSIPSSTTSLGSFQVSIVWTDPPGGASSGGAVLNNLDLSAILDSDSKKILYPNNRLNPDNLNNVEKIMITTPKLGDVMTVKVKGTQVSVTASQNYSMVVSGSYVPAAWYCQDPRSIRPNTLYMTANCRIPCQTFKRNPICCVSDAGDYCTVEEANDTNCVGLVKPSNC